MTEAIRQIYWNIGETGAVILYLTAIVALGVMTWGILRDIDRWRRGLPDARISQIPARAIETLSQIFGQKRVLRDRQPGTMHALIFFGFLALFIGTDVIAVEEDFTIPLIGEDAGRILVGGFYQTYEVILDTMGLVFLAGLVWAAWRRYSVKPDRLNNRSTDLWVLASMLFITVTGYLLEGLRIANQTIGGLEVYQQSWAVNSYVGYGLATLFRGVGLGQGATAALWAHGAFWYLHMFMTFAFVASLPFTKFKHIFYTPLNTFFRDTQPKGALEPIPNLEAEIEKDEPKLGRATLADFTWKQRLDFDACMSCGRCQSKCPANASGSDLSPKFLITKMADLMRGQPILLKDGSVARLHPNVEASTTSEAGEAHQPADGVGEKYRIITGEAETLPLYEHGLFTENELWSCTTCRACMEECPAMIEHVDMIVDLRRNLTMIQSEVPGGVKRVLEGIERAGNPWRLPTRERNAWAAGLDVPTLAEKEQVEVLYWVGCAPSYDERSRKTARAMVQLFQRAGVDFAILGEEETCTGDPARRMGEELLYQQQAQTNIETMGQYTFKKVVTTCAHCFNTIKNEYPQFGGKAGVDYEVIHHTEFLAQLVAEGRLKPEVPVNERVAYHDPCYVGRYNDIYDEPRNVLSQIPGLELVEAPDWNRQRAMCCGGGGGNVWLEGWGKKGVNVIRLEQLQKAKPDTVAVGCPFCMVMFEDAAKNTGVDETLARKDVAELLLQSLPPQADQ
ncbi:MAG TPA: heterodisulfide reductase-related iron-sulfur binding cluster [Roseiflexaceae bacterium]|nr:heterodisulfide reductase-related iron-sulfur binding cluster [Roseiflexaceae bacterium]